MARPSHETERSHETWPSRQTRLSRDHLMSHQTWPSRQTRLSRQASLPSQYVDKHMHMYARHMHINGAS